MADLKKERSSELLDELITTTEKILKALIVARDRIRGENGITDYVAFVYAMGAVDQAFQEYSNYLDRIEKMKGGAE